MNCQRHRLQIVDRLGGALEPDQAAELDRHLERCVECARFEAEQVLLDDLLSVDAVEREVPPAVWAGIQRRLSPPAQPFWVAVAAWLRDLATVPSLRQAAVGLSLALLVSVGLMNLPRERGSEFLTELEAYRLDAGPQNPFLKRESTWNPFFPVEVDQGENIFEQSRNHR